MQLVPGAYAVHSRDLVNNTLALRNQACVAGGMLGERHSATPRGEWGKGDLKLLTPRCLCSNAYAVRCRGLRRSDQRTIRLLHIMLLIPH